MDELVWGLWNVLCDRCGRKYKSNQVQKEPGTGLIVCHGSGTNDCWEPRHPQEFLRIKPDNQAVPYTRPEPTDQYIEPDYIDESVGTQERTPVTGTFDTNNETL